MVREGTVIDDRVLEDVPIREAASIRITIELVEALEGASAYPPPIVPSKDNWAFVFNP
jgi:hypothetical protein